MQEPKDFFHMFLEDFTNQKWIRSTTANIQPIDTDRYTVTEKPEWRKKMLEQEIEAIEVKESHYQDQINHLLSIKLKLLSQKEELKDKLKELDSKK